MLEDVASTLRLAMSEVAFEVRASGSSLAMKGVGGAPDWMQHEMAVWNVGEQLRAIGVAALRRDKGVDRLLEVLAELVGFGELGKGRQALVGLIGDLGSDDVIQAVAAKHLLDDEVSAVLLGALAKRKLPGYSSAAEACLQKSRVPVVQRAARKYLKLNLG